MFGLTTKFSKLVRCNYIFTQIYISTSQNNLWPTGHKCAILKLNKDWGYKTILYHSKCLKIGTNKTLEPSYKGKAKWCLVGSTFHNIQAHLTGISGLQLKLNAVQFPLEPILGTSINHFMPHLCYIWWPALTINIYIYIYNLQWISK